MTYCDSALQHIADSPLPVESAEKIILLDRAAAQDHLQAFLQTDISLVKDDAASGDFSSSLARLPNTRSGNQFVASLRCVLARSSYSGCIAP